MRFPVFIASAATVATALLLYRHSILRDWLHAIVSFAMFIGLAWMIENVLSFIFMLVGYLTGSLPHARREFIEPETDSQIFESSNLGLLVEVDTAGDPTPPSEVNVYVYQWKPSLGAYELSEVVPLSEWRYHDSDPALSQILSRTAPPAVIRSEPPESEFDEIERRLAAPAFHDRTNHGAPLDKPGCEF